MNNNHNFIFEILSEEMPALMQRRLVEDFKKIIFEALNKEIISLKIEQITSFISHRRLGFYLENIASMQEVPASIKIGPKLANNIQNDDIKNHNIIEEANNNKALQGFMRANNLTSNDIFIANENNQQFYAANIKAQSIAITDIIHKLLPIIIIKITNQLPKTMIWNLDCQGDNYQEYGKWIRPIRNILAMFDDKIIDFSYFALKATNYSYCLDRNQKIIIDDASNYFTIMKNNEITINHQERRAKILEQVNKLASSIDLIAIDDENSNLYDEVAGMCENPRALIAKIDDKFTHLPSEILILTLKNNQRYFCLKDNNGKVSQYFIFISNLPNAIFEIAANQEKIINDHQKLVNARLSDAKFFFEEDLKINLIDRHQKLQNILFHQEIGTMLDKTSRIFEISRLVALFVANCDIKKLETSCRIFKNDLTSKMVAELPELQGRVGSFYATIQGYDNDICEAIYQHYLPLSNNINKNIDTKSNSLQNPLPSNPLAIALAISDKIDSIVSFFVYGEKPTSSKDPFAIRRMALGIMRICFDYQIDLPIKLVVNKAISIHSKKIKELAIIDDCKPKIIIDNIYQEINKFFVDRLKFYLKEQYDFNIDIISSILESNINQDNEISWLRYYQKINIINYYFQQYPSLFALYKRIANIIDIVKEKEVDYYNEIVDSKPSVRSFNNNYEIIIYKKLKKLKKNIIKLVRNNNYQQAIEAIIPMIDDFDNFFANNLINDPDLDIRSNRLILLIQARNLFYKIANFDKI